MKPEFSNSSHAVFGSISKIVDVACGTGDLMIDRENIAKQKLEMFKNVPARLLGVVLNGTTAEFGHDGYSYYHY